MNDTPGAVSPPVTWLDEVDSTNSFGRTHFAELPDGSLVVARHQYAGRGRCGRSWQSPPGCCLTASGCFGRIKQGFHAGVIIGLAALDVVREALPGVRVYFKWPNDLYVAHFKLAGILSEGVISGGRLIGVVAGVGLNVNLDEGALRGIGRPATSLCILGNRLFSLENLAERLAQIVFRYYIIYQQNSGMVLRRWRTENRLIGETIEVVDPMGRSNSGIFRRIDADGALVLEDETGRERPFNCGDVRIDLQHINFDELDFSLPDKII